MATAQPIVLTPRRTRVLRAIEAFWLYHGYGPSMREIADMVGLASTSYTHFHVTDLVAKGLVVSEDGISRATRLTQHGRDWLKENDG